MFSLLSNYNTQKLNVNLFDKNYQNILVPRRGIEPLSKPSEDFMLSIALPREKSEQPTNILDYLCFISPTFAIELALILAGEVGIEPDSLSFKG